jgi:hypothetical protein
MPDSKDQEKHSISAACIAEPDRKWPPRIFRILDLPQITVGENRARVRTRHRSAGPVAAASAHDAPADLVKGRETTTTCRLPSAC